MELTQLLLDAGAAVDARAQGAVTPLHVAAETGRTDVVSLLLQVHTEAVLCAPLRVSCTRRLPVARLSAKTTEEPCMGAAGKKKCSRTLARATRSSAAVNLVLLLGAGGR